VVEHAGHVVEHLADDSAAGGELGVGRPRYARRPVATSKNLGPSGAGVPVSSASSLVVTWHSWLSQPKSLLR
jgi:hypothetical protein